MFRQRKPERNMHRRNMGRRNRQFQVGEEFRIATHMALKKFQLSEHEKEYIFPSSLTSNERAYVHKYCLTLSLKTKSRGQGASRYLTVYKKEGSTIVQADAVFDLCSVSRRSTLTLLQRFPLTARERQELLPPTEKDRILGQESFRDVTRTLGRLGSGIPMVPPRRCENELTAFRQTLPIWNSRDEIIQMISCHQTILVSGETGSGKTTQVPQYILEHHSALGQPCRIICTEPRRIAALSIAERVALERGESVGNTVGYQVRLESRVSPKTLLTFCTTGVLLRTLMDGDACIATVSHIIVDELHERDRLCDFLLIVLRDLLLKFRSLKVILMSASLDTQLFSKYFSNCPTIEVPGRVFDVKAYFLEDILKGTGYKNKAMKKYFQDLSKPRSSKLDSWCSVKTKSESLNKASNCLDSSSEHSLSVDNISLSAAENERIELDPRLASVVDKAIEDIWLSGGDDLIPLIELFVSENVSVDYQHSETLVSPLMLAASRGNLDATEQLLELGASLHLKSSNGWTAIEWANHFGHKDVEELLESQSSYSYAQDSANADEQQIELAAEEKMLLDAYMQSIDQDKIDSDLLICLIATICSSSEEGAILVFLPGYDDIMTLREKIVNYGNVLNESRICLFTLHSQMQNADQKRVFKPVPHGLRKIVLATNIAETSITINDVVFVIDCGKVKEKTFDAIAGTSQLKAGWISKASAIQRRGRAGRCRPGQCFHVYSRARFNSFQKFQVPEILRVPIHELCLQAKLLAPPNAPIADFLAKAPDPPPFMVTRNAVTLLKTIDALDPWEELTELGLFLLDLPIEPRLGKMVLYSVILKCLDPVLTVVCCLAYRDPFLLPSLPGQKRAVNAIKRDFASGLYSDHLVLIKAFQAWQKAKGVAGAKEFCQRNFLSAPVLEMISGMRSQLLTQLRSSGFVRPRGAGDLRDLNSNSDNWAVVKAAVCAGTYPNFIRIDRDRKKLITQKESKVCFHRSSILNSTAVPTNKGKAIAFAKKNIANLPSDWIMYEEMMRTGNTAHAVTCSLINPISVALFAGPSRLPLDALHEPDQGYSEDEDSGDDSKYDSQRSLFKIDDWISFRVEPEMARLVLQLRQKWHALFLKRMHSPTKPLSQADEFTVRTICSVLTSEDLALNLPQQPAVGQRWHLDRSVADMGMPPGNSPKHRGSNYSNYNSADGHIHIPASGSRPQSYNSNFGRMSPAHNQMSQSYSSQHPMQQHLGAAKQQVAQHQLALQQADFLQQGNHSQASTSQRPYCRTAYFIIKANTSRAVEISMAQNIFAFTPVTEKKLLSAAKDGKTVVLIFSIQGSGHFQGIARFTGQVADSRPSEFCAPNLGACYHILWLKKAYIPFQSTRHLTNSWNENRKVQASRDGQELEPSVGDALCQLILETSSKYSDAPKTSMQMRPTSYSQEGFSDSSSPVSRGQPHWDISSAGSASWYDPDQKYWSQSSN